MPTPYVPRCGIPSIGAVIESIPVRSFLERRMSAADERGLVEPDPLDVRDTYGQLCQSYRAIDDFRAKLLGFLPLVTGGGLVFLTAKKQDVNTEFFAQVGLFGVVITV